MAIPTLQPTPHDEQVECDRRQRQRMRVVMSFFAIFVGAALVIFMRDYAINGIDAPWVGCVLIGVGVLALLGVDVFLGGPLEKRIDRDA